MNMYELTLIIDSSLEKKDAEVIVEKIKKTITNNKGKIIGIDAWGIRKFAYLIKRKSSGYYYFLQFEIAPDNVEKVEWTYRYEKAILRYLLINLSKEKTYFKQLEINKFKLRKKKEEEKKAKEQKEMKKKSEGLDYTTITKEAKIDDSKPREEKKAPLPLIEEVDAQEKAEPAKATPSTEETSTTEPIKKDEKKKPILNEKQNLNKETVTKISPKETKKEKQVEVKTKNDSQPGGKESA